jgi:molecular chaperone GrpE
MPTSPANEEPSDRARPDTGTVEDAPATLSETDEVAELRDELARAQDRHRRALADLDNYRKRAEREGDRRVTEAREATLREWLEAVDSVERALRMEPGDPGLTAVLEQMEAILARRGVTRLETVGARFDPERHEAIAAQPDADVPDYTVLDVARSGFGLSDGRVLRPAQVVVSRSAGRSGATGGSTQPAGEG